MSLLIFRVVAMAANKNTWQLLSKFQGNIRPLASVTEGTHASLVSGLYARH